LAALDRRSDEGCGDGIDHGNTGERDCQTRCFVQRVMNPASGSVRWPDSSPAEVITKGSPLRVSFDGSFEDTDYLLAKIMFR